MINKRRLRIFWALYFSIAFGFLLTTNVRAYVDPSVMTYAIQAVAGIAIALGAFFGIYWRKAKRKIAKVFKVHFRSNKNVESDQLYFKDPKTNEVVRPHFDATMKTSEKVKAEVPKVEKPKHSWRDLVPAFWLSLSFSFLIAVFAPLDVYLNNSGNFWFDFRTMLVPILAMFVLLFVALLVVFFIGRLIYIRLYQVMLCTGFVALIATYIQGNFLVKDLPSLDGTAFQWNMYTQQTLQSLLLWLIIILIVSVLVRFVHMRGIGRVIHLCSVLLTCVLAVTLVTVGINKKSFADKQNAVITTEGITTVSDQKNFVVLLLDAVDSGTAREIMSEDPDLYNNAFQDFTYYPNTEGAYTFTQYAVPYILTGKWNENQEDFNAFTTQSMDTSPLLTRLRNEQWDMGMYDGDLVYDNDHIFDFENVKNERLHYNSLKRFMKTDLSLAGFKYAPYGVKPIFNFNMKRFNDLKKNENGLEPMTFDHSDIKFNDKLQEGPLQVQDHGNVYRFIHLDGAHVPFDTHADLTPVLDGESSSYEEKVKASLQVSMNYIQALKDAGTFDNSIVIVMADHGFHGDVSEYGDDAYSLRQNPFLMIKGYNENHPLETSEAPISFEDLQEAYQRLMDGKTSDQVFDAKEGDHRKRRFIKYIYTQENHLEEYMQTGYANEKDTFVPTGRVFDAKK